MTDRPNSTPTDPVGQVKTVSPADPVGQVPSETPRIPCATERLRRRCPVCQTCLTCKSFIPKGTEEQIDMDPRFGFAWCREDVQNISDDGSDSCPLWQSSPTAVPHG